MSERTLREIATDVARSLDLGFEVEPDRPNDDPVYREPFPVLVHAESGRRILLSQEWNKEDRIVISGLWPVDRGGKSPSNVSPFDVGTGELPRITVARSKDPAKIAKDIRDRFLPEYNDIFKRCTDLIATRQRVREEIKAAIYQIADAVGRSKANLRTHEPRIADDGLSATLYQYSDIKGSATYTMHFTDSVRIDISSVTPQVAAKIAALLRADHA